MSLADRLQWAVKEGPAPKSIRALHRELEERGWDLSYSTVHRYFKGKTEPSLSLLHEIAGLLRVGPEWLIVGRGPRTQDLPVERLAHDAFMEAFPLCEVFHWDWRSAYAAFVKVAEALKEGGEDAPDAYERAGRMVGESMMAGVDLLKVDQTEMEPRDIQLYASAVATALEIIAPYARNVSSTDHGGSDG